MPGKNQVVASKNRINSTGLPLSTWQGNKNKENNQPLATPTSQEILWCCGAFSHCSQKFNGQEEVEAKKGSE